MSSSATILLLLAMMQSAAADTDPVTVGKVCRNLAADTQDDPLYIHTLATCYFRGHGVELDYVRARQLYAQAARAGYPKAKCAWGNMLLSGLGGEIDIPRGLELCRVAAEAGDADAQTDYGGYLLTGQYVEERDPEAARRWLRAAAEQDQANAAFLLGQILWNGDGIAEDREGAIRWWLVAYENGRLDASTQIANHRVLIAMEGVVRASDADPALIDDAISWFVRAIDEDPDNEARLNSENALNALRALRAELDDIRN